MNKKRAVNLLFLLFIGVFAFAQPSDLARIDYTTLPKNDANLNYERTRFVLNYPIKLNENKSYFVVGVDYSKINLDLEDNNPFMENTDQYQLLDFTLGYTFKMNNNWRFAMTAVPRLSGESKIKDFSSDNLSIRSEVFFIKDELDNEDLKRPYRLILGLTYSSISSIRFPLPTINYFRKFKPNWSYNLGVPKTNLQYWFSEKNRLKLFAQLDGFNSRVNQSLTSNGTLNSEQINMTLGLSGLQYEYYITKHLQLYARAAYIFHEKVNVRDNNWDKIYTLKGDNHLYLRTGIRFKI
ncbi:DUF6268 family outer membrane beta-barrel protein [Aureibaculum sp. 2210JD6-5]|uniref:DUF6268 family outer membrane beta-barrel protein n=1 Tax=Aureibaculum sp. 2210JD6-5 TaxID=3103957 RepID=UPI002AACFD47|nr:DUF6268 family outer membrane beta-barrel protein [Aureibaculum sp. 2210JD6-5]MDY7394962.1 DUF6268 family outer membrane beta-barrel protein [Aureibaculum sp. 2210JD6-5]